MTAVDLKVDDAADRAVIADDGLSPTQHFGRLGRRARGSAWGQGRTRHLRRAARRPAFASWSGRLGGLLVCAPTRALCVDAHC